jgi:flavin reductase (DIM6/NTAB) family NADH-FMN oxidoreductase RutF
MEFDKLFKRITPTDLFETEYDFFGEGFPLSGYPVITSCAGDCYNAMTGSGGGFGTLLKKPVTWCVLRSDRYTLELMESSGFYTMSYFPESYRDQVIYLGTHSGRNSKKMSELKLTVTQTPSGNICFEESGLLIECRLVQSSTITPDDFFEQGAKDYVRDAYESEHAYRKYVFGEILHIWLKK